MKEKGHIGSTLRIRIFSLNNTDGEPGADLLLDNVVINSQDITHKNYIDISKYQVLMPDNGVFIAIECVSASDNLQEKDKISISENMRVERNLLWLNFRDKKWGHSHIPRMDNNGYMAPDIGIEVGYPNR